MDAFPSTTLPYTCYVAQTSQLKRKRENVNARDCLSIGAGATRRDVVPRAVIALHRNPLFYPNSEDSASSNNEFIRRKIRRLRSTLSDSLLTNPAVRLPCAPLHCGLQLAGLHYQGGVRLGPAITWLTTCGTPDAIWQHIWMQAFSPTIGPSDRLPISKRQRTTKRDLETHSDEE